MLGIRRQRDREKAKVTGPRDSVEKGTLPLSALQSQMTHKVRSYIEYCPASHEVLCSRASMDITAILVCMTSEDNKIAQGYFPQDASSHYMTQNSTRITKYTHSKCS